MMDRKTALMNGVEMEHQHLLDQWDESYNPPLKPTYFLKPWQRVAVRFLHRAANVQGFALLCDDMGVGKV